MVLQRTLELRNRVSSIRDEDSGVKLSGSKSPLPTPKFFYGEQTFSSKKERLSQRVKPPPTPRLVGKSCPPVSRLFSHRDRPQRAQFISFKETSSSLLSKYYDTNSDKLYFHQCFEVICKLGSGSFGDVYKVKNKEDEKFYAVKKAKEKFKGKSDRQRKLQEVQKHEQLPNHPNCVRFYKAWEEKQILYIQTELCEFSLSQYADQKHNIPETTVWNFLTDLLLAVKHLHDHNLVHLDIKPDNIFISEDGVCKLGDFGLVLDLSKSDTTDAIEGDPKYLAPELMQGVFTKAADIFSLGITILELASDLDLPRCDDAWHRLRHLEIPLEFLQGLTLELTEVICLMMEPDFEKRPTVDFLLQMNAVKKISYKRKKVLRSIKSEDMITPPREFQPSSDWHSNFSNDVFDDKGSSILNKSDCFDSSIPSDMNCSLSDISAHSIDESYEFSRRQGRIGMSTPCGLRYWESKLLDTSGSPCLSSSKKKCSPNINSPRIIKSPRMQLFLDVDVDVDEEELNTTSSSIPPKNLLDIFNALSSDED